METGNDTFSIDAGAIDSRAIEIFSPEERSDINARIEAASARDAVTLPGLPSKTEAARRGLFPLLVNAGALVLLTAGLCLLSSSQQSDEAKLRESGTVLGVTERALERALIEEIRNEAKSQLNEKEAAIEAMNLRITEVDAELKRLDSLESLTDEQRAAMEKLRGEQEQYRTSLAQLRSDLEILAAREELASLSGDAEKAALIERQLSGFYTSVSRSIETGRYRDAADGVAALKEFLATPSFASIKIIQARHESDTAAVNTLSVLINEALAVVGSAGDGAVIVGAANAGSAGDGVSGDGVPALQENSSQGSSETEAALRQQFARDLTNASSNAAAERNALLAEREKSLAELQKSIADLQEKNNAAQQTVAEQDRQIESLKSQNAAYAQTIERLQRTISSVNSAVNAALEDQ